MTLVKKRSLGAWALLMPEPVVLLCTYDIDGKPNAMTVAWAGVCSNDPPSLQVSVRPNRWTHKALLERKAFTVCVPSVRMLVETDYIGLVSGKTEDKFASTGLTAARADLVDAPYVAECPIVLECSLLESVELTGHTVILGRVHDMKVNEDCLDPSGRFPDITRVAPLIYDDGSVSYYGVGDALGKAFSPGKALKARA